MKNKSLIFVAWLIIFGLILPGSSSGFNAKSIDASVIIGIEKENERIFIGSGVYIQSKIGDGILTAKHVAEAIMKTGEKVIVCNLKKENCNYIDNQFISNSNDSLNDDWAFYKGKFNYKRMKANLKKLSIQDEVFAIGNAWGSQPWISKGNISWIDEKNLIHIQGYCAPGCSGGGVFLRNSVVGIVVAIHFNDLGPETSRLIAIPATEIAIF